MGGVQIKMRVTTYGGLSILNGIPMGLGSACAVDLKVEVDATRGKMDTDSVLVRAILDHFARETGQEYRVEIRSELPEAGGLKSSSAVAAGMISAIARMEGMDVDVPVLAAKLSMECGISVTGALDDAAASFYRGVSVADNSRMKVLRRDAFPDGFSFVIVPRGPRKDFDPQRLRLNWPSFKAISGLVLMKDYLNAMSRNGLTVSKVLGYETEALLRAIELGARSAGITGNGPSMFAVVKEGDEGPVMDHLSGFGKPLITRPV